MIDSKPDTSGLGEIFVDRCHGVRVQIPKLLPFGSSEGGIQLKRRQNSIIQDRRLFEVTMLSSWVFFICFVLFCFVLFFFFLFFFLSFFLLFCCFVFFFFVLGFSVRVESVLIPGIISQKGKSFKTCTGGNIHSGSVRSSTGFPQRHKRHGP